MKRFREYSILPGFKASFAFTVAWLFLIVLLPLSTLVVNTLAIGFEDEPFIVVSGGRETGERVYLKSQDLDDKVWVESDADLAGRTVLAHSYGELEDVDPGEVELKRAPARERLLAGLRRGLPKFVRKVFDRRVLCSFRVSFGAAFAAALIDLLAGGVIAYALVRVRIPGKRVLDALVDLPFAMPTAICGIAMATMYAPNGPVGSIAARFGVKLAFTGTGITLALVFIGLPFVVRSLQPALEDLGTELEDAAMSLGASRLTAWRRVIVPTLAPAMMSGFTLAFARGLGEYGTVIFIAGNTPFKTEIVSLLIVTELEQFDYAGATAIALTMLTLSLALIFGLNRFFLRQRRSHA